MSKKNKKLGVNDVKKKLRRIVNSVGYEYQYQHPEYELEDGSMVTADECTYTNPDGSPSCLVGALLGEVAPAELAKLKVYEWVDTSYPGPNVISAPELMAEGSPVNLLDTFTEDAAKLLCRVQSLQDEGNSWGDSVESALKGYGS